MNIKELNGYSRDNEIVCIKVAGTDAEKFLQGQFSNDISSIKEDSYQFSSYSTNQGKVISLLRIIKDQDSFLLLLTTDISEYFMSKLSMYVLMSKVEIEIMSNYKVYGLSGTASMETIKNNNYENSVFEKEDCYVLNNTSERVSSAIVIHKSNDKLDSLPRFFTSMSFSSLEFNTNKLADMMRGFLRIDMTTKEKYIPQVLNMEILNGISYKKGCYTGQEIVARTHYLGKIKKRIFSIETESESMKYGDVIHNIDSESIGEVISNTQDVQSLNISLAILRLDSLDKELYVNNEKIKKIN
tara:strand:- start:1065 stop:1961 length:897 start_codon:yes stop_codon:yes gene_type:complete